MEKFRLYGKISMWIGLSQLIGILFSIIIPVFAMILVFGLGVLGIIFFIPSLIGIYLGCVAIKYKQNSSQALTGLIINSILAVVSFIGTNYFYLNPPSMGH